jgi:hypothetical protein
MWSLLQGKSEACEALHSALEDQGDTVGLPRNLQQHLQGCRACQNAVDEIVMSRALLGLLPSRAPAPTPWFASRVMAAILAREAELRRSLDTWSVLPKLAARLTGVCALALLLASTWWYERPRPVPGSTDATVESLFDSPPAPASQDDVLVSRLETQK